MIEEFVRSNIAGYELEFIDNGIRSYVEKYWLELTELKRIWAKLIEQTFTWSAGVRVVRSGFSVESQLGGRIFSKAEYWSFSNEAKKLGVKRFAVVEDVGQQDWQKLSELSFIRFAYPIDTSWNEMAQSSHIAEDVFRRLAGCYFVLCDNGKFGKYVDSDAERPYDLYFRAEV